MPPHPASKMPDDPTDLVNVVYECKGDITEIAAFFDVTRQTIKNWIKRFDIAKDVSRARIETDIRARGVIRQRIYEGKPGAAKYWLDRSDKLRLAAGQKIDYDVQTAYDMDNLTQDELDTLEGKYSE